MIRTSVPFENPLRRTTTAVIITTAMLSFISYWRAASVVLCDMASSAYYACGIAEKSIGKAAPWFVIFIMLFSMGVRLVYLESCGMFVRGGVYRTVKAAIGSPLAKFAVSALIFDYMLTGPISAVSAAQYLIHFLNETARLSGYGYIQFPEQTTMLIAIAIIAYFWRKNVIGIGESSTKALRIMQTTTVMMVVLLIWSVITLLLHPAPLPPLTPVIHEHALGWLSGLDWHQTIPAVGIAIALGHSMLAMSGEETLAQVYREIAAPKVRNLKRVATIMAIYTFTLTGIISFLAVMIIPDGVRGSYTDNLLSGLAMHVVGPTPVKLALQAFVVLVGVLILSGAANTSFVGANGTLSRVAEDGILPQWLRHPHRTYGTTSRMFNVIAMVQIAIVLLSQGDIFLLGEAYAFGVIWSFVFQTVSIMVLRWKDASTRLYRAPLNVRFGRYEFPLGIALISGVLLVIAVANFFTKTTATKFGVLFTTVCFLGITWSERYHKRRFAGTPPHLERVNLAFAQSATRESCGLIRKHCLLCAVHDPNNLTHFRQTAERIDPKTTDIIVVSVKGSYVPAEGGNIAELPLDEQLLITNVVAIAEKVGVHVNPLIIPAENAIYAIAKVAFDLGAEEIILGRSGKTRPEIQLEKVAMAWGYASAEQPRRMVLRVIWPQHEVKAELG
ncbi:MAG: APC family permease [Deltaproteobacteria bacterium]|nr:APC family permease [Deltaproteobacteria bacterium]